MTNVPPPPPTTLGLTPSFGFGDRLGLATPGHVAAMKAAGGDIAPMFAQQSIREMTRTGRTPDEVMQDALHGAAQGQWSAPHGADADHLKTKQDVDRTASAGFTFFTIDPSDEVDPQADNYDAATLAERFAAVRDQVPWFEQYLGKSFKLSTGTTVHLDEQACMRSAVKYGRALVKAIDLGRYIHHVQDAAARPVEIELSVDETDQPTTLAEHLIVAQQCLDSGMKLVSLAPRFVGDFEKGIDYRGDLEVLAASLRDHAAIADQLGPYKLSLHSGSDKISMYAAFAQATRGRFHVKTAGTSYLEALRVVARRDGELFRRIIDFARDRFETDRATYHISARLDRVPSPAQTQDDQQLQELYLENWSSVEPGRGFTQPGRQILHCTFGSVLTDGVLGPELRSLLTSHPDDYTRVLKEHFVQHLEPLSQF